jgi:hypothetical protein
MSNPEISRMATLKGLALDKAAELNPTKMLAESGCKTSYLIKFLIISTFIGFIIATAWYAAWWVTLLWALFGAFIFSVFIFRKYIPGLNKLFPDDGMDSATVVPL